MGVLGSARGVEHPLPKADFPFETVQLQTHGTFSGAGRQLGLVFWYNKERKGAGPRPSPQSPEPFRLHRRRHAGRCRGGRGCHTCGCLQRHGRMGERKRGRLRTFRCTDPLAGGRLRQIRGTGNPPRQHLRRHYHGSALLRPRSQRRNLEDRGECVPSHSACRQAVVKECPVFPR